jgi:hypothetical protein
MKQAIAGVQVVRNLYLARRNYVHVVIIASGPMGIVTHDKFIQSLG